MTDRSLAHLPLYERARLLRPRSVDLIALVRSCANRLMVRGGRPPVQIAAPAERLIGRWDRDRLSQILDDLFDAINIPESFRAACEANYTAALQYEPREYPGRIVLLRARSQPVFGHHEDDLGWDPLAAEGVECHVVPGNHESILREPYVRRLADTLIRTLGQLRDPTAPPLVAAHGAHNGVGH